MIKLYLREQNAQKRLPYFVQVYKMKNIFIFRATAGDGTLQYK